MTNYLKKSDFDQSKFYKVPKTIWIDDRIMDDKRGNHFAVRLYMGVGDKIKLSERKHTKENDSSFVDLKGKYFCTLPVKTAREELGLKRGKYNDAKAFLKEIGLIHFEEQEEKKEGVASRIYMTPWEVWVKKNGLYSDGEWIVQPSSKDFYNPKDIVTVQPTFEEIKEIEQAPTKDIAEQTGEDFSTYRDTPDFDESVKAETTTERQFIPPPKPKIIQVVVPKRRSRIN
ncbi:hypothetical protein [Priestia megaterium]|uniref:hypothetical protein n=1 Tax=Priestia megaterium TaxID=1404 RepID=UPI0032D98BC5